MSTDVVVIFCMHARGEQNSKISPNKQQGIVPPPIFPTARLHYTVVHSGVTSFLFFRELLKQNTNFFESRFYVTASLICRPLHPRQYYFSSRQSLEGDSFIAQLHCIPTGNQSTRRQGNPHETAEVEELLCTLQICILQIASKIEITS